MAELDAKELLKQVGKPVPGQKAETFDPMEKIPTLVVGEDLVKGQMVAGTFLVTERLVSDKFTYSKEIDEETGKKVSRRHVLLNGATKFAIWNCGELNLIFQKIVAGQYVELTYLGKEDVNGSQQHRFAVKAGAAPAPTMNS